MIRKIALMLKDAGTVEINKNTIHNDVHLMASSIFEKPFMRKERSFEQVYEHCAYTAIEYALANVIDGQRNPLKFDKTNPESYKYDVIKDDLKFEVKKHAFNNSYFTYQKSNINTFLKHCQTLDYLVTATMATNVDSYLIDFYMIINAKKFSENFKQSKFNEGWYYDHRFNNDNIIIKTME